MDGMDGLLYNQWIDHNNISGERYVNMIKFKYIQAYYAFSKSKVMNPKHWNKKEH